VQGVSTKIIDIRDAKKVKDDKCKKKCYITENDYEEILSNELISKFNKILDEIKNKKRED
jgi:hypothetical protein